MKTRVIIAGAGRAGSELHLEAYRKIADLDVVAICDLDVERARAIAREKGVPNTYASVSDALDALDADILSICTPPSTHFELASLAIRQGVNVLVEKPIFQSLEEAEAIGQLLRGREVRLSAVHNQKYLPGLLEARERVASGEPGEIRHAHAVWMVDGAEDRMTSDPEFWCHGLPGGRWEEMIAHPIYKASQFLGPLRLLHVHSKTAEGRWPWLPDDEVVLSFEAENGYFDLHLSVNARKYNHMLLYGTRKTLYVDSTRVVDLREGVKALLPSARPTLLRRLRNKLLPRRSETSKQLQDHELLIRDFVASVRDPSLEPPVSWDEAYATLALVLQVGQALAEGSDTIRP